MPKFEHVFILLHLLFVENSEVIEDESPFAV